MPEQTSSRIATTIAFFGWVIALASLALNWATYNDSQKAREREARNTPVYSYDLSTFPTQSLPKELLTLKQPIEHQFEVRHHSGNQIEGLALEFRSDDAKIIKIDITEGQTSTEKVIYAGGKEASLKKAELIPETALRGTVVTEGVTPLTLSIAADSGQDLESIRSERSSNREKIDWEFILIISILIMFTLLILALFYFAIPEIKESGILGSNKKTKPKVFLLLSLLMLLILPISIIPSASQILNTLILYLLIVNYKKLSKLVDRLTEPDEISDH